MDFNEIYEKYHNLIFRICREYFSTEDSEDLTQEIFITINDAFNKGLYDEDKGSIYTYISRIAHSKCYHFNLKLNANKRKANGTVELDSEENLFDLPCEVNNDKIELMKVLNNILDPDDLYLITIVYVDGYSYKETSEMLGIDVSNVKRKLHKIKKELRNHPEILQFMY